MGTRPFRNGATIAALIEAMRDRPVLPIRHRGLRAVLARGLDRDPARRWPNIAAFGGRIHRLDNAPDYWRYGIELQHFFRIAEAHVCWRSGCAARA